MATEKDSSSPGLLRRPAVLAAGSGVVTAGTLGALFVGPTVLADLGTVAGLATSTGEGIAAIVGTGVGLLATGIAAASTKGHWESSEPTGGCGVVDKTESRENDYYEKYTAYHCAHDGSARRSLLRSIAAPVFAVGAAAAVVGGLAAGMGFEHSAAQIALDLGTGVAAAGGITGAASLLRVKPAKAALGE